MEEESQEKQDLIKHSKSESPFVFISHDTRDAEIAEAFSKLLKSVSAGMLKSFRSSDNKGTQGIEYGMEWYPKIIESLQDSSDVVCLLTELSINRPWILFEAGMAKGKLNTPILGIAVGVPLHNVSIGPFAQFQNCDDDVASLTKLVKQLVKKLPNSEPDEDVIRHQVEVFKSKSQEIIKARQEKPEVEEVEKTTDANESAKLFEEVKLMFKELPTRIENASQRTSNKNIKRLHAGIMEDLTHYAFSRNINAKVVFQMTFAPLKIDFPWIYEGGLLLVEKAEKAGKGKYIQTTKEYDEFMELVVFTFDIPIYREMLRDEQLREISYLIERFFKMLVHNRNVEAEI